ncbi:MAG: carbonic anhydrase [Gammaproteobacteria bacterium]|nr:carbonic anhydrase [Gammaproteobacteria bacterium]
MTTEIVPDDVATLFANNRDWVAQMERETPGFFAKLAAQQVPKFLWIGCSDSRVPANPITGLALGEVFVHRNVANIISPTDMNCMAVVDFAIRRLKVRHVIVCGHYGCAGVRAAIDGQTEGVTGSWISGVRHLWEQHEPELSKLEPGAAQARMCELNVELQVQTLCETTVIREAWEQGQQIDIHGWIFSINDGLLRDLGIRVTGP